MTHYRIDFVLLKYLVYGLIITSALCSICFADNGDRTLIFFSADWCRYCAMAKSDINTHRLLSETIKKYEVIILDFDKDKDQVEGYKIKNIPTFIVIENKKEIKRQIGYDGPMQLNAFLK